MVTNESILEFEIAGIPLGQYIAIFREVQPTEHPQWGKGVMFVFEVATGEFKGQMVSRIGKRNPTPANSTGMMIACLTGKPISDGHVSLRELIGKPYNILVEMSENNKARVAQVWPYQRQGQAAVAQQPAPQPVPPVHQFPQQTTVYVNPPVLDDDLDSIPF